MKTNTMRLVVCFFLALGTGFVYAQVGEAPVSIHKSKSIAAKVECPAQCTSNETSKRIDSLQRFHKRLSKLVDQRAEYLSQLSRVHLAASLTANGSQLKPRIKDFGSKLGRADLAKAHLESARYELLNARAAVKRSKVMRAQKYLDEAHDTLIYVIDDLE